jgi:hypothetical protein
MQAPVQVPIPCASECLQAADGFLQDVDALAEREADEGCALVLVVVEDGVGDGDDTGAFGEGAAEGEAVGFAEGADVGGDEVRAGGAEDLETGVREAAGEDVALGAQGVAQPGVVAVREGQGLGDGVLEGAGGDIGSGTAWPSGRRRPVREWRSPRSMPADTHLDGSLAGSGDGLAVPTHRPVSPEHAYREGRTS